jgi:hypothetical protein
MDPLAFGWLTLPKASMVGQAIQELWAPLTPVRVGENARVDARQAHSDAGGLCTRHAAVCQVSTSTHDNRMYAFLGAGAII